MKAQKRKLRESPLCEVSTSTRYYFKIFFLLFLLSGMLGLFYFVVIAFTLIIVTSKIFEMGLYDIWLCIMGVIVFYLGILLSITELEESTRIRIYKDGFIYHRRNKYLKEIFIPFREIEKIEKKEDTRVDIIWKDDLYAINKDWYENCYKCLYNLLQSQTHCPKDI